MDKGKDLLPPIPTGTTPNGTPREDGGSYMKQYEKNKERPQYKVCVKLMIIFLIIQSIKTLSSDFAKSTF